MSHAHSLCHAYTKQKVTKSRTHMHLCAHQSHVAQTNLKINADTDTQSHRHKQKIQLRHTHIHSTIKSLVRVCTMGGGGCMHACVPADTVLHACATWVTTLVSVGAAVHNKENDARCMQGAEQQQWSTHTYTHTCN
eukprot:GDKI01037746.1.p1 GENE.GDKI01037746.1~~GDKI01037746.1.p1  ORF type:complete len:160 (+),score=31.50 GDKI01037746.1:73-480(+)